ncbi:MAG: MBL fold metallo-hydrolase [Coriobacteriia bacterium]|nr:MBL fold metallo-hydrolase [Coriobacteriia bacterium]
MHVETVLITIGPFFTMNCYLASASEKADSVVIIDPGGGAKHILNAVGDRKVDAIILTHRHHDHISALGDLRKLWENGVSIYVHELDRNATIAYLREHKGARLANDIDSCLLTLKDGDVLTFDTMNFTIMHTPGHTIGSMCLYVADEDVLFSGDTLFKGTTGRTDFPTGSPKQMRESLQYLSHLPDKTVVLPGHESSTTIAHERHWALIEY